MHIVQKWLNKIDTNDEFAQEVFTKNGFHGTIYTVPETLPIPIPKTLPSISGRDILRRLEGFGMDIITVLRDIYNRKMSVYFHNIPVRIHK